MHIYRESLTSKIQASLNYQIDTVTRMYTYDDRMSERIFARRTIPLLEKTVIFSKTIDGIAKFNVML